MNLRSIRAHRRWPQLVEIGKYATGCLCGILLKIIVSAAASALGFAVWSSYLFSQIAVLFFSYGYHSRITFGHRAVGFGKKIKHFGVYFGSVLIFKLADYLIVVLGAGYLTALLASHHELDYWLKQLLVSGMIVASSGFVFFIRYFWYRVLFKNKPPEAGAEL
jgi:putative flippase GtrA